MLNIENIKKRLFKSGLWRNGLTRIMIVALATLLAVTVGLTLLAVRPQAGRVIIAYTPFDKRLGPWYEFWQIPLAGFIIIIANVILAGLVYHKDRLMSYLLLSAALLAEILIVVIITNFIIYPL